MRLRLIPTLVSAVLAVALSMGGVAGIALAADEAAPGDVLYGVDRLMERIQERVTRDPERLTELRMAFADERMDEVQRLIQKRDQTRLREAVGEYGEALRAMAGGPPEDSQALGEAAQLARMNQMVGDHEDQLEAPWREQERTETRAGDGWWSDYLDDGEGFHPVVENLAGTYEISATEVVSWFVDGYGLGEIMHALETSEVISGTNVISDTTPSGILKLRTELGGWGLVWQKLELIGRGPDPEQPLDMEPQDGRGPDGEGPPGQLKDKGGKETGPPEGVNPPGLDKSKGKGPKN